MFFKVELLCIVLILVSKYKFNRMNKNEVKMLLAIKYGRVIVLLERRL